MIKSHPTLAVQKPYRLLSLSVVSIMVSIASQTVVANDSIPSTGSASGAAATEAGESSNACLLQP